MTQTSNQFAQTTEKGMLSEAINTNLFNVRIDPASVATLSGGAPVKMVDIAGEQIVVDLATLAADDIWGFLPLGVKTNEFAAGKFTRAAINLSVMYMEASAAIARGADLEIVPTGVKVATNAGGTSIGRALDKATADGDLIRVLIKTS